MPAKRLPWYKVWAEHLDHPKVCELTDGEYRTWHYLIAKASQQPVRWYFASTAHAAKVTGRPLAQIKKLLAYGLLEEGATPLSQGIWIHNAPKWQNKYPSDYFVNAPGTLLEFCQNVAVNAAATPISDTDTETEGDTESPRPIRSRESNGREESDQAFAGFWESYPPRDGRKLDKAKAKAAYARHVKPSQQADVLRAVEALKASDQKPKDAFRWLQGDWEQWLEPAISGNGTKRNRDGMSPPLEEWRPEQHAV